MEILPGAGNLANDPGLGKSQILKENLQPPLYYTNTIPNYNRQKPSQKTTANQNAALWRAVPRNTSTEHFHI